MTPSESSKLLRRQAAWGCRAVEETKNTLKVSKFSHQFVAMARSHPSNSSVDPVRDRIVATARRHLFSHGYTALTMDVLATELGMSKKTLYVHFAGKDALVDAVVLEFADELKALAAELFGDRSLGYAAKLARFTREMTDRFARVPPSLFRELQRYAPEVHRHIEELRFNTIPIVFGRMIAEGKKAGMVRREVDPAFATEFWRAAIQGVMHPDAQERLGLRPDQVFGQALALFCGGLLTVDGMNDYENVSLH